MYTLKSPATWQFVQHRSFALLALFKESPSVTSGFPSQRTSNTESIYFHVVTPTWSDWVQPLVHCFAYLYFVGVSLNKFNVVTIGVHCSTCLKCCLKKISFNSQLLHNCLWKTMRLSVIVYVSMKICVHDMIFTFVSGSPWAVTVPANCECNQIWIQGLALLTLSQDKTGITNHDFQM